MRENVRVLIGRRKRNVRVLKTMFILRSRAAQRRWATVRCLTFRFYFFRIFQRFIGAFNCYLFDLSSDEGCVRISECVSVEIRLSLMETSRRSCEFDYGFARMCLLLIFLLRVVFCMGFSMFSWWYFYIKKIAKYLLETSTSVGRSPKLALCCRNVCAYVSVNFQNQYFLTLPFS